MREIKRRVEKLEDSIHSKDKPLKIIMVAPGQTTEDAVAAFHEKNMDSKGLIIIIEK
jgi:hypothetical protein